jgi:hypothetical protein
MGMKPVDSDSGVGDVDTPAFGRDEVRNSTRCLLSKIVQNLLKSLPPVSPIIRGSWSH